MPFWLSKSDLIYNFFQASFEFKLTEFKSWVEQFCMNYISILQPEFHFRAYHYCLILLNEAIANVELHFSDSSKVYVILNLTDVKDANVFL